MYVGSKNEGENLDTLLKLARLLEEFVDTLDLSAPLTAAYQWKGGQQLPSYPTTLLSLCSKRFSFHRKPTKQFTKRLPEMIKLATLLQEFTLLNITAFRKILKKFDKHLGTSTMSSGMKPTEMFWLEPQCLVQLYTLLVCFLIDILVEMVYRLFAD